MPLLRLLADRWTRAWARGRSPAAVRPPQRRRAVVEALEPRLLYSADLHPGLWAGDTVSAAQVRSVEAAIPPRQEASATQGLLARPQRVELLIVDSRIGNPQSLLDDLRARGGAEVRYELHTLDTRRDGLQQVGALLEGRQDIAALHLVSHGSQGRLLLGRDEVDAGALQAQADDLRRWSQALGADADILLYGCDVAAGGADGAGPAFTQLLATLTQADVAASDDATGAAVAGGDWALEARNGRIETATAAPLGFDGTLGLVPQGGETLVHPGSTTGSQVTTAPGGRNVAMDAAGNFVVVWASDADDSGDVYLRRYDASGVALGAPQRVNTTTADAQVDPTVAMNADGSFVVAWSSLGQDGVGSWGVYAQRFSSTGVAQGGEIHVNASRSTGDQLDPSVAIAGDGSFAVAYTDQNVDAGTIVVQRFAADGTPTTELSMGSPTDDDRHARIAMNDAGQAVVAWETGTGMVSYGVRAQVLDAGGALSGGVIAVNQTIAGDQVDASVGIAADGRFVVAWSSQNQDGGGTWGVYARRFDAAGVALGNEFLVNTVTAGDQSVPVLAMNTDGHFAVVWNDSAADGDGSGIFMRQYSADGRAVGGQTQVNATVAGNQSGPSIAFAGTRAVVVWSGNGSGDTDGVFFQRHLDEVGAVTVSTSADTADGDTSSIEALRADRGLDGQISLREAIVATNNTGNSSAGADAIRFAVGSGTANLTLGSGLDALTDAVLIDGWTQPGYAGTPRLILDGNQLASYGLDFQDGSDGSTVRGLVLRDFATHGIRIVTGADGITVQGNYIGAFGTGGVDLGPSEGIGASAVWIAGSNATIGGSTPEQRNLIAGNLGTGIWLEGGSGSVVSGNYIGLAADGTTVIGNAWDGVTIAGGGSGHRIGGTAAGEGNRIAGHGDDGIEVNAGTGHALLGNLIWANASQGIDLGGNDNTPVPNDAGDVDSGANNLQNTPELTVARTDGSSAVSVTGTLDSAANGHYRVEFFASTTQHASGHGEAQRYLGFVNVPTDGNGDAAGTFSFSASLAVGEYVTAIATATDASYGVFGDSSQFAANVAAVSSVQATVTVTTTADTPDGDTRSLSTLIARPGADGQISLREAIVAANNTTNGSGGADRIHFGIGSALVSGVHTLTLSHDGADAGTVPDDLPMIVDAVVIDGSSEPDFTNRPVIVLDGGGVVTDGLRLYPGSDGSTVRGLVIHRVTDNQIDIAGSDGNSVVGNWLGLSSDGTASAGNAYNLNIWNSNGNLIGGPDAADRNVISGSASAAIVINTDNGSSTGNRIRGNYIGTDASGTAAVGNVAQGVWVNAAGNQIGGTAADEGNVISGTTTWVGVQLTDTASGTLIAGNLIGLDATGTAALGNAGGGLYIESADNVIGGTTPEARNVIAGNGGTGIVLWGATAQRNLVTGNHIGVDAGGTQVFANQGNGIWIGGGAADNLIGGSAAGQANLIGGNTASGIEIDAAAGNVVRGNLIGTDAAGTRDLGNGSFGIALRNGATGTAVGGAADGEGNRIAFNGASGISVTGAATDDNPLLRNLVYSNGGLAVDLSGGGTVDTNDAGDVDTGANQQQNRPTIDSVTRSATQVLITGTLGSTPGGHYRIEFYAAATDGQAARYLGTMQATADGSGNLAFSTTLTASVATGEYVTALATESDPSGTTFTNTSELSAGRVAVAPNSAPSGTDGSIGAVEDTAYVFSLADFGFVDGDGHALQRVYIDVLPLAGALRLDGTARSTAFSLDAADIAAGRLSYLAPADASGTALASLSFRVQDDGGTALGGSDTDPVANTLSLDVAAVPDAPTGAPAITGTATEDQTLGVDTSAIADADGLGAFGYQWLRDGIAVGSATGSTYTLGDADVGARLSVTVSWTDGGGTPQQLTSAQTAVVGNVNDAPTGVPTITGTPTENQTLSVNTGAIADAEGLGSFSFQWLRDGVAIGSATSSSYGLGDADVGARISVTVSYIDGAGQPESLTSAQTAPVGNVNDAPTGAPSISGTPLEDGTLTALTGGIADADGLGAFGYQWLRDGVAVGGATGSTYTLGDADVGARMSVTVSWTDGGSTPEQLTSAQTAVVANVNDVPTGAPAITGTATEDQTLGVDTSTIADADGLGTFGYQWLRDGVAVGGATGATYALGDADVGARLSVTVAWTDGRGTPQQLTSAQTAIVGNVNDAPTGAPAITGTATEDQTLGVDTSTIADADGLGTFGYQWLRDGVAVGGATGATYALGDADVGARLSVTVSWTDGGGTPQQLTSAQTAIVGNVNDAPTGAPTITGTATEDQTLGVDASAIADNDGLGSFGYQWLRDGVAIGGATGATYTLGDADVGSRLSVTVAWTDGGGTPQQLTSAQTAVVGNVNDAPTGAPAITGTATEDQTLGVDTSAIADADGLGVFGYQWLRDGVAVGGATGATYTLGDADVGARLSVTVSWTDGGGTPQQLTSAQTAIVGNVNDAPTGAPAITGTATEDQTLGVDTSAIADADGLGIFGYQWLRDGVAVGGANGATYTLGDADVGARLSVAVSWTDGGGTPQQLTSAQTAVVGNVNDAPTGVPTITGTPTENQTLSVNTSALADADGLGALSFQWLRDGVAVGGATSSSYGLGDADVGARISVTVSYTDGAGQPESVTSVQTAPVGNLNDAPTGAPSISGTPLEDRMLTVLTGGIGDADGLGTFSYQWRRDGAAIAGATGSTYLLGDADVGARISVSVSYTDAGGAAEQLTSGSTVPIVGLNDSPTGAPVVTGTPLEGRLLSADIGGIGDADGLGTPSYQWLRDGVAIGGATAADHLLTRDDVGARLSVRIAYLDGQGTAETLTSAPSAVITGLDRPVSGTPRILGTPVEDATLAADTSGLSDADGLGAFSYQWLRDGIAVAGATGDRYTLGDDDVGARIGLQVTHVDALGTREDLRAADTAAVANVDDAATGLPLLRGTAVEDGSLSADVGGIADADGLGAFEYQWLRDGVAVDGATASGYRLGDADVGARMSVVVSYTDGQGTRTTLASAPSARVAGIDDAPTGRPVVVGTPTEDQVLTADTSAIDDADGLGPFAYQWWRDGVAIEGATGASHRLGDADVGARMSVSLRWTDGQGTGEALTSASTAPVDNLNDPLQGAPSIRGLIEVGQVLSAELGELYDADGLGPVSYQWLRDGVAIEGATGARYTVAQDDAGSRLSVQVSLLDARGSAEATVSTAVGPVGPAAELPARPGDGLPPPGGGSEPGRPVPPPEAAPDATPSPDGRLPFAIDREAPAIEDRVAVTTLLEPLEEPGPAGPPAAPVPRVRLDVQEPPEAAAWAPEPASFELALTRLASRADGDADESAEADGLYDGLLVGRGRGGGADTLDEGGGAASRGSPARQLLEALTDPLTVSSATLTAGLLWWATRYGGLIATAMMGIPAWRQVDLMPVLARGLPDDDELDDDDRPAAAEGPDGDDDAGLSEMLAIDDTPPAATAAALPDPPAAPVPTP